MQGKQIYILHIIPLNIKSGNLNIIIQYSIIQETCKISVQECGRFKIELKVYDNTRKD